MTEAEFGVTPQQYIRKDESAHYKFSYWSNLAALDPVTRNVRVTAIYDVEIHELELTATNAATCTEAGYYTYTCTCCGQNVHETIPALGHQLSSATYDGEEAKTHTGVCERCHRTVTENCSFVFDHYEVTEVGTTVLADVTYKCTVCGGEYVAHEALYNHIHHTDEGYPEEFQASCIHRAICTECGLPYGYYDSEVNPSNGYRNHHNGELVEFEGYAATCTATGLSSGQQCPDCGELIGVTVLPKKDHVDSNNDGKCDTCGMKMSNGNASGFKCSMCRDTDGKFTGIAAIRHFFVHIIEYLKYIFGGRRS